MPRLPRIDERSADEVAAQLRALLPSFLPDWDPDDAVAEALIRAFAHMSDTVRARVNRAPAKHLARFLAAHGIQRIPAVPARTFARFDLVEGVPESLLVPRLTQLTAPADNEDGELAFETLREMRAVPGKLTHVFAVDPEGAIRRIPPGFLERKPDTPPAPTFELVTFAGAAGTTLQLDHATDLSEGAHLFVGDGTRSREPVEVTTVEDTLVTLERPLQFDHEDGTRVSVVETFTPFDGIDFQVHALHVGHAELFALEREAEIHLWFEVAPGQGARVPLELLWEFWGELGDEPASWRSLELVADSTAGLARTGDVHLANVAVGQLVPRFAELEIAGRTGRWVRARVARSLPTRLRDDLPRLDQVRIRVERGKASAALLPQAAFHNTTPLTIPAPGSDAIQRGFFPFSTEPQRFDSFYIASAEVFSKKGADVAINFSFGFFSNAAAVGGAKRVGVYVASSRQGLFRLLYPDDDPEDPRLEKLGPPKDPTRPKAVFEIYAARRAVAVRIDGDPVRHAVFVWVAEQRADRAAAFSVFRATIDATEGAEPTWDTLGNPSDEGHLGSELTAIRSGGATRLFVVSDEGVVHELSDGTWTPLEGLAATSPVAAVEFGGALRLFAGGDGGVMGRDPSTGQWTEAQLGSPRGVALPPLALARGADLFLYVVVDHGKGGKTLERLHVGKPQGQRHLGPVVSAASGFVDALGRSRVFVLGSRRVILQYVDDGAPRALTGAGDGPFAPHAVPVVLPPADEREAEAAFLPGEDDRLVTVQFASVLDRQPMGEVLPFEEPWKVPDGTDLTELRVLRLLKEQASRLRHVRELDEVDPDARVLTTKSDFVSSHSLREYKVIRRRSDSTFVARGGTKNTIELSDVDVQTEEGDVLRIEKEMPSAEGDLVILELLGVVQTIRKDEGHRTATMRTVWQKGQDLAPDDGTEYTVWESLQDLTTQPSMRLASLDGLLLDAGERLELLGGDAGAHEVATTVPRFGVVKFKSGGAPNASGGVRVRLAPGLDREHRDVQSEERNPDLSWEYWNGNGWRGLVVQDRTRNFLVPGEVEFCVPEDIEATDVAGQESLWIRARLVGGDYGRVFFEFVKATIRGAPDTLVPSNAKIRAPFVTGIGISYALCPGVEPQACLTLNNLAYRDQTAACNRRGTTFRPFDVPDSEDRALYLGFSEPFGGGGLSVLFDVAEIEAGERSPTVVWEVRGGGRWMQVSAEDASRGFTEPGVVDLLVSDETPREGFFGQAAYWVRARLVDPFWNERTPHVAGIHPNAVRVLQAKSVTGEILGSSNGEASLVLAFLSTGILPGEELRVLEVLSEKERRTLDELGAGEVVQPPDLGGIWVRWRAVDGFFDSGPEDRHYVIDRARGLVRFGDGVRGRIPSTEPDGIRAFHYQTGGGLIGNVPAGAIEGLSNALEGVESAYNPLPAGGGADAATGEEMLVRGPERLRHRDRAVTAGDYEALALAASRTVALSRCLARRDPRGRRAAGWVELLIVPSSEDPLPMPTLELRRAVRAYVAERAPAAVARRGRLTVRGPRYVVVDVLAEVRADSLEHASGVVRDVELALARFLHPICGGPRGKGLGFGRGVHASDIFALLMQVAHVDHVRELVFVADGVRVEGVSVSVPQDALVASGSHAVEVDVVEGRS